MHEFLDISNLQEHEKELEELKQNQESKAISEATNISEEKKEHIVILSELSKMLTPEMESLVITNTAKQDDHKYFIRITRDILDYRTKIKTGDIKIIYEIHSDEIFKNDKKQTSNFIDKFLKLILMLVKDSEEDKIQIYEEARKGTV
jgi:hypothetical protein